MVDFHRPFPWILAEFYHRCGHCKALAPHYEEAATTLKDKDIKLAKVDCVDQADLCQSHGVQGYPFVHCSKSYLAYANHLSTAPWKSSATANPPTIPVPERQTVSSATCSSTLYFSSPIRSYWHHPRQSLPAVSDVTASNLIEFQNADKLVVLAYVSSTTKAPAPEFTATAEKLRDDYLFGITSDAAAIAAAGVTPPAIVVYRNFDEHVTEYPNPASAATIPELEAWIQQLSIPILGEVNGETYAMYAGSGKPIAYLFLDPADEKSDETIAALKPVAAKYRGEINFVWIDATKFGDHAKALNLAEPKWPSFVIQSLEDQLKYPYDQSKPVEAEAVSAMVGEYLAGKLLPKLKSQPIPETQDGNVFTLVGNQFDEVVYDDSKDVFVEFYATWCVVLVLVVVYGASYLRPI
jgi:protein disulfide-isomerase A1